MDPWLQQLASEPFGRLALHQALDGALAQFYAFTLVLVRMSGLMIVGPVFGQASVPVNVRVLLTIALSLLLTPLLADRNDRGFDRLDSNGDEQLSADEIPPGLMPRYDQLRSAANLPQDAALSRSQYGLQIALPGSVPDYARIAAGELVLGLLLGTGVLAVLSGLQMAGQLIDQQSGLALGEVFNPDMGGSISLTGQSLFWLGTMVFVLAAPLSGHLVMIRVLAETFDTMPIGAAVLSGSTADLLNQLVQQSLLLGLRVAAPVMVMMSLTDLTFGFLNHSVPQINIQSVGFSLRAFLGLLLLSVTITSVPEIAAATLAEALDQLRDALVYPR